MISYTWSNLFKYLEFLIASNENLSLSRAEYGVDFEVLPNKKCFMTSNSPKIYTS